MFANTNSSHDNPSPKHSSAVYTSDLSFSWSDPDLDDTQDGGGSSPMVKSPWNNKWLLLEPVATPKRRSTTALVGRLVREEGHVYSLATKFGGFLYTGSDSKNIRVWKGLKDYAGFESSSGLVKAIVIAGGREDLYGSSRWHDPGLQGLEKGPERTQMVRVFTDVQGLVQVVHQA